jgi:hypothetical protein
MDSAIVTGAFTLAGAVVGGLSTWFTARGADSRAAAKRRDDAFAALADVCVRLQVEARSWRALDTTKSKLRQLYFGLLQTEAVSPVATAPNVTAALTRWLAGGGAYGLKHLHPVEQADRLRQHLTPLLSEAVVLTVQMSMNGDQAVKDACERVGAAAAELVEHIGDEKPRDYAKREVELEAAVGQLRRARDAAAARWWRRRKMRQHVTGAETPLQALTGQ